MAKAKGEGRKGIDSWTNNGHGMSIQGTHKATPSKPVKNTKKGK